jgi:hypothetical protein
MAEIELQRSTINTSFPQQPLDLLAPQVLAACSFPVEIAGFEVQDS